MVEALVRVDRVVRGFCGSCLAAAEGVVFVVAAGVFLAAAAVGVFLAVDVCAAGVFFAAAGVFFAAAGGVFDAATGELCSGSASDWINWPDCTASRRATKSA